MGFLGAAATARNVLTYCGLITLGDTPRQAVRGVAEDSQRAAGCARLVYGLLEPIRVDLKGEGAGRTLLKMAWCRPAMRADQ
jgi:hypothetical protein